MRGRKQYADFSLAEQLVLVGLIGYMSCWLHRSVADQFSQLWNELNFFQPVLEVLPKRNAELAACFLQGREGISTAPTGFASCPATYFASFHMLADSVLAEIVMQWNFRIAEHQKQLGFIVVDAFDGIV